jgi:hypothetical protein
MHYNVADVVTGALKNRSILRQCETATDALVRLDERLKGAHESLREGFAARSHYFEALGLTHQSGRLLHLEDLVLHDHSADIRVPTDEVLYGARALAKRRAFAKRAARDLLSEATLSELTGLQMPVVGLGLDDPEENGDVDSVPEIVAALSPLPRLLASLILWDFWRWHEREAFGEAGVFLAAAYLKGNGLTTAHVPLLARGLSQTRRRWQHSAEAGERILALAEAAWEAGRLGYADLQRLTLAREQMARKCEGRSRDSHLASYAELFIELPLVTTEVASKRLRVSKQAVLHMQRQLGSALPRERTGRQRYRAWGIL